MPISVTGEGWDDGSIGLEGIGESGGEVRIVDDRAVLSCASESK